jgi:hypothetical protein
MKAVNYYKSCNIISRKKMGKISLVYVIIASLFCINGSCSCIKDRGDWRLSTVGKYNVDMAYMFDISDNHAFLGTNRGLLILDISNRAKPVRVTELKLGFIRSVTVIGSIAYLGGGGNGFILVDVSDVRNPKVLGNYRDQGEVYGFARSGSYAYICDRLEGLKVIDVQDPLNPKKISQWSNGGQYWDIEIRDHIAYVADSKDGLELIDISDPSSLSLIATVPNSKGAESIQFNDKRICLGSFHGISVFDITDPEMPRLILSTLADSEVLEGCVSENLLFAGCGGIIVYDVSKPDEPVRLATWTLRGGVHGLLYDGQYIYTVKKGFYIMKLQAQRTQ